MKNFKRIMSIILTIAIVASVNINVLAATTLVNESKARTLYDMGLFNGYSNTSYQPGLADLSDRAQAIVVIGRAMGWDVSGYTTTVFTDVPSYAIGYVQYAVDNNITNGIGGGKFGSDMPVTSMQVFTWYYRALGYKQSLGKDAWNNVSALVSANMITEYQLDQVDDELQLNRDAIVGVMYTSMRWKAANSELTLVQNLVETGKVDGNIAVSKGFITNTALVVDQIVVLTHEKVKIVFNKEVDAVTTGNFKMSNSVITKATRQSDNKSVLVEFTNGIPGDFMTLSISGITQYKVDQKALTYSFTIPAASKMYVPVLSFANDVTQIKSDGISSVVLTYELQDAEGNRANIDFNLEVAFTTYYGKLSAQRVELTDGRAQVIFTSENLNYSVNAPIAAQVTDSDFVDMIGKTNQISIEMTPNPKASNTPSDKSIIKEVIANSTSTVRVIFNDKISVGDYLNSNGTINSGKLYLSLRKNATNGNEGVAVVIKSVKGVADNPYAMDIILDTDSYTVNALADNADAWLYMIDTSKEDTVIAEKTFKVTDTTKPYVESIKSIGDTKIQVTMSEPVVDQVISARATNLDNWLLDNRALGGGAYGTPVITVGEYDLVTQIDNRHIILIDFGTKYKMHPTNLQYLAVQNLGDWASLTDATNYLERETVTFTVSPADTVNYNVPLASLTVQSPEQWVLTFDQAVNETALDISKNLQLQYYYPSSNEWRDLGTVGVYKKIDNTLQDLVVTKVDSKNFVIETDMDWTSYWHPYSAGADHTLYQYRLYVAKAAVTASSSGLTNSLQYLSLGGPMLTKDVTTPSVIGIKATEGKAIGTSYDVTFSEPIKLNAVANSEGATQSMIQGFVPKTEDWNKIPSGSVTFYKADNSVTLYGLIDTTFRDGYDQVIRVYPIQGTPSVPVALSEGNWNVVIQSLTDDAGNTMSTAVVPVYVTTSQAGGVAGAPEVKWAFADVDKDMYVQDIDGSDGDASYDYMYIKFSKAMMTTGSTNNVLNVSNYRLNGKDLPSGSLISSNIEGYDDVDTVIDSITIRMPNGTLTNRNNNHTLYISMYVQSIDGIGIGANFNTQNLPYSNTSWSVSMNTDIQTELSKMLYINLLGNSVNNLNNGIDSGEMNAVVSNYISAMSEISALPATSLVKASYLNKANEYLTAVKNHQDYESFMGAFYYISIVSEQFLYMYLDSVMPIVNFDGNMPGTTSPRYTVTVQDRNNYGYLASFNKGTGQIVLNYNKGYDNNVTYEQKIIIRDNLLEVSKAVIITITDDAGNDSFTVRHD